MTPAAASDTVACSLARWTAGYSLASLLVCGACDRQLQPSWTAGTRTYLFLCGCRQAAVNATDVERLVLGRIEADTVVSIGDLQPHELGRVFSGCFVEVRIAGSAEELTYVWRI